MQPVRLIALRLAQTLPALLPDIGADRRAGRRVFVLVPEQYTLQAERELLEGLGLPGLMDLDVLSPRRLERLIHETAGRPRLPALTDSGRAMVFAQALDDCADSLKCYRRAADRAGLPDKLSALIGDMEKALMTPEELEDIAAACPSEGLRLKLNDLTAVWRAYQARISGRFAGEAEYQADICARFAASGLMRGAALYVCGFDVLQPGMISLLCEAARQCDSVSVALTMSGSRAPDARIFLTQRRTAEELSARLRAEGLLCAWQWDHAADPQKDAPAPAIAHLEQHLFARDGGPLSCDPRTVRLHTAADPYEEAAACAATLMAWREEGIPWERMAVAVASPDESLLGLMDATLEAAGIPRSVSRKDAVLRHGLARLLFDSVCAVCGGYEQEYMLGVIKSGFAPLTPEEARALENYAIENGITRGRWREPFRRGKDEKATEAAEALRQRLMDPLTRLHQRLRDSRDATASVEALWLLLSETDAYQRLLRREEELLDAGLVAQAGQSRQVWQLLLTLMDQMAALLGGHRATMAELPRLLEAGLAAAAIASLPAMPQAVTVGEAGHLMTGRVDALAVVGLQDGGGAMDSLLSDSERALLSHGAMRSVGLSRAEENALRQSDFYRTFTLPSRYLCLSCSLADQQGGALRPSILLSDIRRLLPEAQVTGGVTMQGELRLLSPQTALEELAPRLRAALEGGYAPPERSLEAMRQLLSHPVWAGPARRALAALRAVNQAGPLPPGKAERLYRSEHVSVSRLEDYARCPYRGFVTRGLRPKRRRDWIYDLDQQGEFFHAVLERYTALAAERAGWPDVSEEEEAALFEEAARPLREEWIGSPLDDDAMSRRQGEELVRTAHSAARMFTHHARRSGFSASRAEVRFGRGGSLPPLILELPDGSRAALEGTIDRVDFWDGGGVRFLTVVDHKSGDRQLDKEQIWYGLQLQLLLYLRAASEGASLLPGGAFYFRIQDPLITGEGLASEVERELARRMRLKGVVLADTRVVDTLTAGEEAPIESPFNKKDGRIGKNKLACDLEQLRRLMDYAAQKAAGLASGMRSGVIDLSPVQLGDFDACANCPLKGHCPLDETLPGQGPRRLDSGDKEALWAQIIGEGGSGG